MSILIAPEGAHALSVAGREFVVSDGQIDTEDAPNNVVEQLLYVGCRKPREGEVVISSEVAQKSEKQAFMHLLEMRGRKVPKNKTLPELRDMYNAALAEEAAAEKAGAGKPAS